jgi:hypothetical protein
MGSLSLVVARLLAARLLAARLLAAGCTQGWLQGFLSFGFL